MKNIPLILLLFSIMIFFANCKKQDDTLSHEITYPKTYHGTPNLLVDSNFVVKPGIRYSIAAYLPKGTSIKLQCNPTDETNWGAAGFFNEEREGYTYQENYPNNIVFEAKGSNGYVNVPVMFGESGPISRTSINLTIFENESATATRVKTVRNFEIN